MTRPETQTGRTWRLIDGDEQLSRNQARRAPWVAPEVIEEAMFSGLIAPHNSSTVVVFGRDAAGRLVKTELPETLDGLSGERLAAVRWLRGSGKARWLRVKLDALGAVR